MIRFEWFDWNDLICLGVVFLRVTVWLYIPKIMECDETIEVLRLWQCVCVCVWRLSLYVCVMTDVTGDEIHRIYRIWHGDGDDGYYTVIRIKFTLKVLHLYFGILLSYLLLSFPISIFKSSIFFGSASEVLSGAKEPHTRLQTFQQWGRKFCLLLLLRS